MMKTAVALFFIVVLAQAAKFPPNFKKCNRNDPNAAECIKEAARDGIRQLTKEYPEIHLLSADPLEIKELKIAAGSQGVVNVDQNFKNCKLYGIDKAELETFEFNFDEKIVHGTGVFPEIRKVCEYELNGKVLLLPIVGSGPSTIVLKNVKFEARFNFEEVKRKGKTFLNFITYNLKLDPEFVSFDFENLFNGDKQLGDNINKVLNENSKEVFADVHKGYEDGIGLVVKQLLNNLFNKVSVEEAFD